MARKKKSGNKRGAKGNWGVPRHVSKAPPRDMYQEYKSLRSFQSNVDFERCLYEAIVKLEKMKRLKEGKLDRTQRDRFKSAAKRELCDLKAITYGCTFSRVPAFEERVIRLWSMIKNIEYEEAMHSWKFHQKFLSNEDLVKHMQAFLTVIENSKRSIPLHFHYLGS